MYSKFQAHVHDSDFNALSALVVVFIYLYMFYFVFYKVPSYLNDSFSSLTLLRPISTRFWHR